MDSRGYRVPRPPKDLTFNSIEWIRSWRQHRGHYCWRCFQFHWMDSYRTFTAPRSSGQRLSIPLNGFIYSRVTLITRGAISFNSIEWIQGTPRDCNIRFVRFRLSIPLNGFRKHASSLESNLRECLSIPLNGFGRPWSRCSPELTTLHFFQFHWMDSSKHKRHRCSISNRNLSIPLNGFKDVVSGFDNLYDDSHLSIPLNGFVRGH